MIGKTRMRPKYKVLVIGTVVGLLLIAVLVFNVWRASPQEATQTRAVESSNEPAEVILTQEDLEAAEKSLAELNFADKSAEAAELQADL